MIAHAGRTEATEWLRHLVADLNIPTLSTYGIKPEDTTDIVARAQKASSMKGNPVELTAAEIAAAVTAGL